MNTTELNNSLVESYFALLKNLNTEVKLDLITRLIQSIKNPVKDGEEHPIEYFYGIWDSKQSAEEIITDIQNTRVSTRQIEDL